jgi:hypothetical protein
MKISQIIVRVLITIGCIGAFIGIWAFFAWGLIGGAFWARDGQEASTPWMFLVAAGVTYGSWYVIAETWRSRDEP